MIEHNIQIFKKLISTKISFYTALKIKIKIDHFVADVINNFFSLLKSIKIFVRFIKYHTIQDKFHLLSSAFYQRL